MWFLKKIEEYLSKFSNRYSSELEKYIVSHNPQSEADIERLTVEYHKKLYY